MKIGYDAKRLFCNFRGLGNYSRTLIENLQNIYPDNDYHLYTSKIVKGFKDAEKFYSDRFKLHMPRSKRSIFWRLSGVVDEIKQDKLDIFHGLSHELPIGLKKAGVKSIVTIHDLIFEANTKAHPFIDRNIYSLKAKYSCKNSDRIIAISENTKRDIVGYYNIAPEKIDVIYQSCNPIFFHQNSSSYNLSVLKKFNISDEYFMFVGSAEQNKNLGLIVKAYSLLPKDLRIPVLLICKGDSKYKQNLIAEIEKARLVEYFIWIDNLTDNNELKSLYQCSRGLLFPSFYEGFGLPVVEALLCEAPVIVSNTSSLPEAGGPNSIYFNPNVAEELASGIERVLVDTEYVKLMKRSGLDYAMNNFHPELFAKKVMDCYLKT